MREYPIVAVLWQDHIKYDRMPVFENPDDGLINPTLTVGILFRKSKKTFLVIHDIERYHEHDDASFTVILRNAIVSKKKYGMIKLSKLR